MCSIGATREAERNGGHQPVLKQVARWNVVRFLFCGGATLVILGWSGVVGLLGSFSSMGLFNPPRWINWIHLSFGAFVLAVAMTGNKRVQLVLALLASVGATAIGLAGLLILPNAAARSGTLGSTDLSDPLAHLAVGLLAIWALRNSKHEDRSVPVSRIS